MLAFSLDNGIIPLIHIWFRLVKRANRLDLAIVYLNIDSKIRCEDEIEYKEEDVWYGWLENEELCDQISYWT